MHFDELSEICVQFLIGNLTLLQINNLWIDHMPQAENANTAFYTDDTAMCSVIYYNLHLFTVSQ